MKKLTLKTVQNYGRKKSDCSRRLFSRLGCFCLLICVFSICPVLKAQINVQSVISRTINGLTFQFKPIDNTTNLRLTSVVSTPIIDNVTIVIPQTITDQGITYTVTEVSSTAFDNWYQTNTINTIEFPATLDSICAPRMIRRGNSTVNKLIFHGLAPMANPQGLDWIFRNCSSIEVPCSAMQQYLSKAPWSSYRTRIEGADEYLEIIDKPVYVANLTGCSLSYADTVTITTKGILYLYNLDNTGAERQGLNGKSFKIEKTLQVGDWNLIGTHTDGAEYFILDNNIGNNSHFAHDMYACAYNYSNNSWGNYAYYNETMPGKGQSVMVYPATHKIGGQEDLNDETVVITRKKLVNLNDFSLALTNNSESNNDPKWFALANPFICPMNLGYMYSDNSEQLKSIGYFLNDSGDWQEFDITDTTQFFRAFTGFMAASKNDQSDVTIDYKVEYAELHSANYEPNILKSATIESNIVFSASTDKASKKMYARLDSHALNSYDKEDSYVMMSNNEDAVNPYFSLNGRKILDNRFNSLPYVCEIAFNAYKDKNVSFSLDKSPANIEVSLIDILNNSERVLNMGENVEIFANTGENTGRYKIKFALKNSSLQDMGYKENTIRIYNNDKQIFVEGKNLRRVEIYNTLGQKVQTENIGGEKAILENALPAGAYMVKAYNANKESKSEKIIVR